MSAIEVRGSFLINALSDTAYDFMDKRLVKLLVCPSCRRALDLVKFTTATGGEASKLDANTNQEVSAGVFKCECGNVYPVIDGVPRFLEGGLTPFPEFVDAHREQLAQLGNVKLPSRVGTDAKGENDYENIRKSFSQEWGFFDYDHDKTWGWTLKERQEVFLGDVQLNSASLRGKRMLDAGCGNGTLTAALSEFGMEIVGLDLNDGLGRAYANRGKYAETAETLVQYVQGNLVTPPLQADAFDLIYSSGVIHHTPSSNVTFESLARLVKPGGRLYIWVYGKRGWPVRLFFWLGRGLKSVVSLNAVFRVCRLLAPIYKMSALLVSAMGFMKFRQRTTREITLDLFDAFAPRFNHWHTPDEVRSWFQKSGFVNMSVSGVQKHGFGMYGDRPE